MGNSRAVFKVAVGDLRLHSGPAEERGEGVVERLVGVAVVAEIMEQLEYAEGVEPTVELGVALGEVGRVLADVVPGFWECVLVEEVAECGEKTREKCGAYKGGSKPCWMTYSRKPTQT